MTTVVADENLGRWMTYSQEEQEDGEVVEARWLLMILPWWKRKKKEDVSMTPPAMEGHIFGKDHQSSTEAPHYS
eukprot:CAMPEP_0117422668 /NCGR_PEP_ID=MMETSP0758-20121206/3467_1 /TAXON_ID=63605 /ORGANISM="Percolomonas cosmopolitus, Strain AE-1 (ATCC 50343)" /LENGTH=73 /DNA_ID=CAMNT_0005205437 /DNA_START=1212 /DNA_END=1433 /DNA_ORIENTATION=-